MPIANTGRLAIWNDCATDYQAEFETWYQTEHLGERLSVPGFRRGRRYEAIDPHAGYFTYYETDNPDVLTSSTYLQRVNNPTLMTAHVMREAFTDVSRTVCQATISIGSKRGAFATTLQLSRLPERDDLLKWAEAKSRVSLIARIEGWAAVDVIKSPSTEEQLRGGDGRIGACLLVETLRGKVSRLVKEDLAEMFGVTGRRAASFRLLCELAND